LQTLKSLKNLRRLDLRGSSITDSGLANLSGLHELRELSLSRAAVSDAGLKHLTNLEWLALSNTAVTTTAVTTSGAKALKKHLPTCEMSW
jgi:internalin A